MKQLSSVLLIVMAIGDSGCMKTDLNNTHGPANTVILVGDYQSFDAALAACPSSNSCTLSVPAGTFATSHYGAGCIRQSNITIIGSGQPDYDNINAPTKLQGGTILQPGLAFCGASNIFVSDLGIDDGPAYVTTGAGD